MKNNCSIGILIATYNGDLFLTEQLNSILNQTNCDWNIFINDDGSTDDTMAIINDFTLKYPNKIHLLNIKPKRLGSSANFFSLLNLVQSDYYMFCDQDDFWLPTKIERSLRKMKEMEAANCSQPIIIHPSFHRFTRVDPEKFNSYNYLGVMNCVTGCTMLFNKHVKLLSIKYKGNKVWHDWWLGVLTAKEGKLAYINEATLLYRQHSKNVLGAREVNISYLFYILRTLRTTFQIDIQNYKNLKNINYGSFLKYSYFKILFQLKR
jgi:glycosyltransferase involved in cell wall biosynthesis